MHTTTRIPKYARHRGSGQACVMLAGRTIYLGPYGTKASRDKYDSVIAEWIVGGRRPLVTADAMTIAELIAAYRRHCSEYYRDAAGTPSKAITSIDESLKFLFRLFKGTSALEFGPLRLKAVRQAMIDKGLVRANINRHIGRIKQMIKWAVGCELLPGSSYQALQAVPGLMAGRSSAKESSPVQPVPIEQVEAILPAVSRQVAAMIKLQLLSGCRPGEIVLLRPGDLDQSGPVWTFIPERHKNQHRGHRRTIYFGPKAQEVLKPFLAMGKPDQAYLFSPGDAEGERREALHLARKTPMSCGNKPGSNRRRKPKRKPRPRYDVGSYYNAIRRACMDVFPPPAHLARQTLATGPTRQRNETESEWKARLGPKLWGELVQWRHEHSWHPHRLRHATATAIRQKFGLEVAGAVLGHASLRATEIYAEKSAVAAQDAMSQVG